MEKEAFNLIGISIRTTNEKGQSAQDIRELWSRFFAESILEKIPHKINSEIYSVYTDYEGDHMKPYQITLGCKVNSLENIPQGMVGKKIASGNYKKFEAKGNLNQGAIFDAWSQIWEENLDRTYVADYEIYGEKAQNPEDAEVDIFIAVK